MYDVIVVGSGATGGWVAKELSERGLRVVVLEAGSAQTTPLLASKQVEESLSACEIQQRCRVFNRWTRPYFIDDRRHPYSVPSNQPFSWIRTDIVGGRTTIWGGQVYRLSEYDLQAASRDGHGVNWPVTYSELAPYYDRIERFLGVTGTLEGIPQLPDGIFQPPEFAQSAIEEHLVYVAKQAGMRLISARVTRHRSLKGLSPCPHCGKIDPNCQRYTSSVETTLTAALKTERVELRTGLQVERIVLGVARQASGVQVVERETGRRFEIAGRLIFLCASALESTRILLNSRSEPFPNGVGNSSGMLGRYLTVHLYGPQVIGQVRLPRPIRDRELGRIRLLYLPRWHNLERQTHPAFPRGFGSLVSITPLHLAISDPPACFNPTSLGNAASKLNDRYLVGLHAFGETIPRYDNYVELDPDGRVDALGIPVLKIHYSYSASDYAMAEEIVAVGSSLIHRARGSVIKIQKQLAEPGLCIHEVGTCRMGNDSGRSVVNRYNQSHDMLNLFVVDGSVFPSLPSQNPTLTMMALAVRASEYACEQFRAWQVSAQVEGA